MLLDYTDFQGVHTHITGPPQEVLQRQAELGFAGLSEAVMKRLVDELGCLLDDLPKGENERARLEVSLLKHLNATLSTAEALRTLQSAWAKEFPGAAASWAVHDEVALEVLTDREQRDMKTYTAEVCEQDAKRLKRATVLQGMVAKHFKAPMVDAVAKAKAKKKAVAPRWLPKEDETTAQVTDFARQHAPKPMKSWRTPSMADGFCCMTARPRGACHGRAEG
jgi:hypothetical protein